MTLHDFEKICHQYSIEYDDLNVVIVDSMGHKIDILDEYDFNIYDYGDEITYYMCSFSDVAAISVEKSDIDKIIQKYF